MICAIWHEQFEDQDDFLHWCRDDLRVPASTFDLDNFINTLRSKDASRIIGALIARGKE